MCKHGLQWSSWLLRGVVVFQLVGCGPCYACEFGRCEDSIIISKSVLFLVVINACHADR